MKKKIIIVAIVILVTGIILAKECIFYDRYKIPKKAELEISNENIEVYTETKLYDLIKSSNVEILTKNADLDYMTIGEHSYTIEYKYKMRKYLYDIKYNVVDTINPIFIRAASTKTLYVNEGDETSLTKKVSYADNYDTKPKLEIEGNVNFSQVGTYKIKYIITDQSGNKATKDAIIEVTEKKENIDNEKEEENEDFVTIEEQIEKYKTDDTMIGIDISKWQGEVDFEKVKNAGVEFVILRMGVMKDKDTPIAIDNTFKDNCQKAKDVGLKVGVYVYSESNTTQSAIENAEFVINNLNGDKLDFPICFDWECWTNFNELEINLYMLNEMYDAFSNKMKEAGYDTMLYASENYLNNTWLTLKDYTIWVAKYSNKTPSVNNKDYILWQNTEKGRVDGIKEAVDFDIYYKK